MLVDYLDFIRRASFLDIFKRGVIGALKRIFSITLLILCA